MKPNLYPSSTFTDGSHTILAKVMIFRIKWMSSSLMHEPLKKSLGVFIFSSIKMGNDGWFPALWWRLKETVVSKCFVPCPTHRRFKQLVLNFLLLPQHWIRWCSYNAGFCWWLSGKESAYQCRIHGFSPWVRKIPWRRKLQPTPVFLPGEFHGQWSLVGYSP